MRKDREISLRGVVLGRGRPKICVPLMGTTAEELARACGPVKTCPFDIIEWRADFLETLEEKEEALQAIRKGLPDAPLLATLRTAGEGGAARVSDEEYFSFLRWLIRSGQIDGIDIEYFHEETARNRAAAEARAAGLAVVMSSHDFAKTPPREEMETRLAEMGAGGNIAKLAVMPKNASDVAALLAATAAVHEKYPERPLITMAMGALGAVSRVAGGTFGSAVTFGAADRASAPGQMDAGALRDILDALYGEQTKERKI